MDDNQFTELSTLVTEIRAALDDIAASLRVLKEATVADIRRLEAQRARQEQPQHAPRPPWRRADGQPLRDGDSYGIVAAQPTTATSPEPAVHADHPPGHLRSSHEC